MSDDIDRMLTMLIISRDSSPWLMRDNKGQSDREVVEQAIEAGVIPHSTERYLDQYSTAIYPENHMDEVDYRKVIVPVEPVDYDVVGEGLFRNGFVRVARGEVFELLLGFIDAVESRLDIKALEKFWEGVMEWDPSKCRELLPRDNGFEEKIGKLKAMLEKLPDEIHDVFSIRTTAKVKKKSKEPEPEMSVLALEACNRGCPHCAVYASVGLPKLKFKDLEKWVKVILPGSEVAISYGEPFFWNDNGKNIADIIKLLLEFPDTGVQIVTSGINFSSEKERKAAEDLAALPLELKKRIRFVVSVSTFPKFKVEGAKGGEANLKVLRDILRFAWENGIRFSTHNFLPKEGAFETIVAPVVKEIKPEAFEEDCLAIEGACLSQGALQDRGRRGENELDYDMGEHPHSRCLFRPESSASMQVAVAGDGSVLPGCCMFTSPFIKIGDLTTDDRAAIKEKVAAFSRMGRNERGITDYERKYLSEEERPIWEGVKRGKALGFNCDDCLALPRKIRHAKRAKKVIGPERFEDVVACCLAKKE